VGLLERAIGRDPSFARAYAGLARAHDALVMNGHEEWNVVAGKSEPAARKALQFGPDSAEAHAAMAEIHGMLDRFEASITEAERAIAINPNLSEAFEILGRQRATLGALDPALVALRKSLELDPLAVRTALLLAWVAQLAGNEEEALEVLERTARLSPQDPRVADGLAEYYRLRGELGSAQQVLVRGLEDHPDNLPLRVDLGVLHAVSGERKQAETILRTLEGLPNEVSRMYGKLFIHAALGDLDPAFEALGTLAEMHAWPLLTRAHPTFASMRQDPRFATFCAKVGLPT
jgi:serine/threonine-protein kinase